MEPRLNSNYIHSNNNKNSSDSCNEVGNLANEIIVDNRTLIIMILLHYQSAQYMR